MEGLVLLKNLDLESRGDCPFVIPTSYNLSMPRPNVEKQGANWVGTSLTTLPHLSPFEQARAFTAHWFVQDHTRGLRVQAATLSYD